VSDDELANAAVVIDALLGTGVTGPVTGELGEMITRTNAIRGGRKVIAVDLPTGVDADTGLIHGPAISAEVTVTMGALKPCLVLFPGTQQAGRLVVADIGIPPEVFEYRPSLAQVPTKQQAATWLPRRPATAHKRSVGWMMAIAGSFGMTGAASMACTAAYRSGAGLVRLALPSSLVPALNATLTEVVCRPLPETARGTLSYKAVALLLAEASEVQAALIGPGLSRNAATQLAIRRLVACWPGPLVVDADALTAMAGADELLAQRTAPTIITPHPGEMSRLMGEPVAELEANRIVTAQRAAKRFNAITVYKGTPTIIAAPSGEIYVNPTGNAGLAVAGTGDVLAGSITALLAQGIPSLQAATLGAYLGGHAADMIAAEMDYRGMTALDLIEMIPYALKALSPSL
jgi:NAD(P)H-hydrate epimerase